ncbi:MAG: FAD-linked oxidase C-terminal domain-containing protein [bacterium]|nr:FAD-linked oxidase C-terminal domain-containing protein [bacterium]
MIDTQYKPLSKSARDQIRRIVGPDHCSDSSEDLVLYAYDAMNRRFPPEMVAHPENARQVSAIVKLANREMFPVIPRGGGTGFTGGSLAVEGGVVLTTSRMNRIVEVDPDNMSAWVEPGVINGDLQKAVLEKDLFFPPDPSSMDFSTIGGNVAENAGGPRAVKYGVTRDYVMALEVVMPDGRIVRTGSEAIKSVTGYDLTRLLVGSEGTLGFITKILVRLLPRPEAVVTLLTAFPDVSTASRAVARIMASRIIPSTLEFMDRSAIDCVKGSISEELSKGASALLLVEVDGDELGAGRQAERLTEVCKRSGALYVKRAQTPEEREGLWKVRRSLSPAIMKIRPLKINEDVSVPRMKIPELIIGIEEIARQHDVMVVNFGHAGDGNVHVNILVDPDDKDERKRAEEAVKDLFQLTVDLGGSLTGEHGIGIAKAPYLGMEIDDNLIHVMRTIKRALDPNNVMNPSKTFDYRGNSG